MLYNNLFDGKKISNFGFGLYKGEETNLKDKEILKSIFYGLKRGINVIDTAQKYRNGRSERLIRKVLKRNKRESLVILSKAGLLPNYVKKNDTLKKLFVKKSNCLIEMDFCIDPKFINWSVENSLKLMNTDYIDFYLLHNPEIALLLKDGHNKIIDALYVLEKKRKEKKILYYGVATWNGFRRFSNSNKQLNIEKILKTLKNKVGEDHGFRCIEAPINIGMPDILNFKTSKNFNFENFLIKNKINFFSSASLYEGKLEQLVELNKIFNSTSIKKDLSNETKKANISFPQSENSLRRLFILLENFRKNNINLANIKLNYLKNTNIFGVNINFLRCVPFIKSSLIGGMEEKNFISFNSKQFSNKLKLVNSKKIWSLWKKIKVNL
jgi:hypothetical protein